MTVYESIWSYMKENCSKWMYMKMYDAYYGIWLYIKRYGCNMKVCEAMWWYVDAYDGVWVFGALMAVYERIWW